MLFLETKLSTQNEKYIQGERENLSSLFVPAKSKRFSTGHEKNILDKPSYLKQNKNIDFDHFKKWAGENLITSFSWNKSS